MAPQPTQPAFVSAVRTGFTEDLVSVSTLGLAPGAASDRGTNDVEAHLLPAPAARLERRGVSALLARGPRPDRGRACRVGGDQAVHPGAHPPAGGERRVAGAQRRVARTVRRRS